MRDPIDASPEKPPVTPAVTPPLLGGDLAALRATIRRLERDSGAAPVEGVDLGCVPVMQALPEEGLMRGRVHEVVGEMRSDVRDGACFGFAAALLVTLAQECTGPILWCPRDANCLGGGLSAQGFAAFGLDPNRVVMIDARSEADRLWVMAEALATGGVCAILAEFDPMTATGSGSGAGGGAGGGATGLRRLQLAAEKSGVTGLILRPRGVTARVRVDRPSGAVETRWRVTAAPSHMNSHDWRPAWSVVLDRARRGRVRPANPWVLTWSLDGGAGRFEVLSQGGDISTQAAPNQAAPNQKTARGALPGETAAIRRVA
jgi:protein ImuA